jgi:hypothetical protein
MLLTKKYSFRPRVKAMKCHIMADYLETGLFIRIYVTAIGIIIQWRWPECGFSRSIYE